MVDRRRFPKSARLRHSTEVRAMFRAGARRSCGTLEVFLRDSTDLRNPRLVIVVPKHGHTIVERNRLRRRIRETLRTHWLPVERKRPRPRDLLVRATAQAYELEFDELAAGLADCLELEPC
ncbi:MAG: ribonuclease P protein component [Rhodothermia bacterium]